MDHFHETILTVVRSIPRGRVMSYGQVAAYVGEPKASREVGWAMQTLGNTPDFPWWRVVNSAGQISITGNPDASAELQQTLLADEGIACTAPLTIDIERYRYRADTDTLASFGLSPEAAEDVHQQFELQQPPLL